MHTPNIMSHDVINSKRDYFDAPNVAPNLATPNISDDTLYFAQSLIQAELSHW